MATETSAQALLLKERPLSSRKPRTLLLEVNSRDRNYTNVVKANPFQYTLQTPIKDIRSIELVGATIPAKPMNVTPNNNRFTIREGHLFREIVIPVGYYTEDALIAELPVALSIDSKHTYSVRRSALGKLVFIQDSGEDFEFLFFSAQRPDIFDPTTGALIELRTPALLLGFDSSDYVGERGALVAPHPLDLSTHLTRLYLYLNVQNSLDLSCISRGSGRRAPYAIIYLDTNTNGYKFLNKETFSPISFSLPQPISRLTSIQVDFRDEFYQSVDFNGKDFTLLFECTVLE